MSRRRGAGSRGPLLELWRPPADAGPALGCLATTYTFTPALFDEQCLARFLGIESEPDRESLAFLLERESLLRGAYAGVLVDHSQAGVEHSLRWDLLPVRIPGALQHAKLSLLVWARHARVIVASANLTEPGYRTNQEVAATVELTPEAADQSLLADALAFLRDLLAFVPGAAEPPAAVDRAAAFLDRVENLTSSWRRPKRGGPVRQRLALTLPEAPSGTAARSSLSMAIDGCFSRGAGPSQAWVASPFFDCVAGKGDVTAALYRVMARKTPLSVRFCLPGRREDGAPARLDAPRVLLETASRFRGRTEVAILPIEDADHNPRVWHAKMLALRAEEYSALMVGSSNFTAAGMGTTSRRNAEANLLTIVDRVTYGRETGELEAVWPPVTQVDRPEEAVWEGGRSDDGETTGPDGVPPPAGFLSVTYRAGEKPGLILQFAPKHLPDEWSISAGDQTDTPILEARTWRAAGAPERVEIDWPGAEPPERLLVSWGEHRAFLPINVEDSRQLPPPTNLEKMTADEMLAILAASDPGAAFRAWARRREAPDGFDAVLDSAAPPELDPLLQHDLQATFLHRIRRRARVLAALRANLERPVWSPEALDWRLRGLLGLEPLAQRLLRELAASDGAADEALLALSDFLLVLREVDYRPTGGSLDRDDFGAAYRPFLDDLTGRLDVAVHAQSDRFGADILDFWQRMVRR